MVTLKDLSSVINNDVLQDLFIQRNETIAFVSVEDKKNLKVLYDNQKQTRQALANSLDNLPDCFSACKEQIIECVDNHIDASGEVTGYFDEKLYKSGVVDGMALLLESIKNGKLKTANLGVDI